MAASQSTLPPNSLLKQYDVYDVRQCGLPMFDGSRDLRKISKLGQGCSSNVYLVATESRKQLALKCLDPRAIEDQDHFDSLAGDIFREAHTLTSLDHNNIIKIRGVSTRQPSESFANDVGASWENGVGFGYFFLMDDLEETLMDRMKRWSKDKGSFSPKGCRTLSKLLKKKRKVDLVKMIERIETAAMGVAQGMEYLHGKNIIMQDLKPVSREKMDYQTRSCQ
jgi:serine/threonine protein kinase